MTTAVTDPRSMVRPEFLELTVPATLPATTELVAESLAEMRKARVLLESATGPMTQTRAIMALDAALDRLDARLGPVLAAIGDGGDVPAQAGSVIPDADAHTIMLLARLGSYTIQGVTLIHDLSHDTFLALAASVVSAIPPSRWPST